MNPTVTVKMQDSGVPQSIIVTLSLAAVVAREAAAVQTLQLGNNNQSSRVSVDDCSLRSSCHCCLPWAKPEGKQ